MRQLSTHLVHKVWGRHQPPAPFTNPGDEPLGEIWFDPPPELADLLVKFIFTDAALSVQVHPNDAQAPAGKRGKNECWYILDAQPGAKIAVGLRRQMDVDALRAAALDGSIEDELGYVEVAAGDFFSIPAGTIHAIGAGITLLEVQQNSDITYRLYDYGRPRELHLEDGLRVATRAAYDPALRSRDGEGAYCELIDGPFFRLATLAEGGTVPQGRFASHALLLPLTPGVTLNGQTLDVGTCTLVEGAGGLEVAAGSRVALIEDPAAMAGE
ncbi:MAG: mannose-6-phosphate isomerase [Erythrobacter sp.]|nr:mannose-6-phosphate isomerase [Erythrobacter sp.]NCQ63576.1 mannose-6-phosphate isomerase [Alphaproteobacteria bacterium]